MDDSTLTSIMQQLEGLLQRQLQIVERVDALYAKQADNMVLLEKIHNSTVIQTDYDKHLLWSQEEVKNLWSNIEELHKRHDDVKDFRRGVIPLVAIFITLYLGNIGLDISIIALVLNHIAKAH